jgi:phenylalanine-4-hydroxylase
MPYRSDCIQPLYFVIDGVDSLRTGIDLDRLEGLLDAV